MKQLFVALLTLVISSVRGQEIQSFLANVQDYAVTNPVEKVYLHTDKPSYSAGETIFFKSYCTVGIHNHFSNWSGILYAELLSPTNDIVQRVTISTPIGVGLGDFTLADTITEGVYRIRAYTNWMKNAGSAYFFEKKVPIYNGRSDNVLTNTTYTERENDVLYHINLKNVSGLPLAKTRISYHIVDGTKNVEKKSATSTPNGQIDIPVPKKYKQPLIKLRFENGDKSLVNKVIKTVNIQQKPRTGLYPEGGKIVQGRINNIAAKSINSRGLGIRSTIVFKQGKDTLGILRTNELGMGATAILFNDTTALESICMYADGSQEFLEMPKIYQSGYAIRVNTNNDSKIYAQLDVSTDLMNSSDVYFVVHYMGEVIFVSKSKLTKEEIIFTLDKANLPSGVLTISILDHQYKPILERPIFHYNKDKISQANIKLNKASFGTRDKVQVDLKIENVKEPDHIGSYSASIIDLSKVDTSLTQEANIVSALLLKSDIKGYIERPNYYFNKDGAIKREELDFLLLTQGWRNIEWHKINADSTVEFEREKMLKISGYTKKIGRSKAEPNAKVQLISTKNFMDFVDTTANEDGYFEFDNLVFPDSVKFLVSARDAVKGKNNIDIIYNVDKGFPITDDTTGGLWWDINAQYLDNLKSSQEFFAELERTGLKDKAILIEEVVVTARKEPKVSEYSSNLNGPGRADQVLGADELSTCPTLEMCLSGRLLGVYFQNGVPYSTRGNVPMQVILDGMYIEPENLSMVNISDIESVEVLRNINYTAIYGSNGGNGLLILTSKHGTSALNNYVPKGILTIQPQGFHVLKEFYKPDYEVEEGLKFNTDLRSTIHWEPSIVTNNEGQASFEFFTSDSKGKYLMSIQGVDLSGRILNKTLEISVE